LVVVVALTVVVVAGFAVVVDLGVVVVRSPRVDSTTVGVAYPVAVGPG